MLTVMPTTSSERADAARNRRKILAAAARMVASGDAERLSLDVVAREADVGVGTVYRRFGDRAGLVFALLAEQDKLFRARLVGDPPTEGDTADAPTEGSTAYGPTEGGDTAEGTPGEQLRRFLYALVDLVVAQRELLLVAEASSPASRYVSDSYAFQHAHVSRLVAALRPDADASWLADALLAPFAPSLVDHQRETAGFSPERIKAGFDQLLRGVLPPEPDA